jgi:urate oxidase/2-oxo-4-hydroxy-4-carboxy-5-ureidoimidazoline decarboxylase
LNHFASGPKRHYYGKGDVIVYRLHRGKGAAGRSPVFGARVLMLLYGDAFWNSYETGDNTGLIATDSMKNFIQRETINFEGRDLESYCRFIATTFLSKYSQVEGLQVSAAELRYEGLSGEVACAPSGPDRAIARIELSRRGIIEAASGIRDFRLLRPRGSAFEGFVRDEYTSLPDRRNRPLHMWLDVEWTYVKPDAAFTDGAVTVHARQIVLGVFASLESRSIQQVIYEVGKKLLAEIPAIAQVRLEAQNRTWDTIAEQGDELGVYTDARPPYGCIGLTLDR